MENLRKKNETETQNTVEDHFSRLEQVEDTILELKYKIEIEKKQKSCESNNSRPVKGICKNSLTPSKN
jgi:hypothetical protein